MKSLHDNVKDGYNNNSNTSSNNNIIDVFVISGRNSRNLI